MQRRRLLAVLRLALARRQLARLTRKFEDGPIRGYVTAIGAKFILVTVVSDRLWYDGFECFRVDDLLSADVDEYAPFAERALRLRGQRKPRTPQLGLDSTRKLVEGAGRRFPLLALHREELEPDVCHIGALQGVNAAQVQLLEISPDARWDSEVSSYRLREITRVSFGGGYEDALHLVASDRAA
jgi:hypothetical protein